MFDISGPELLTILLIALVVVGPRRLPEMARRLGRWAAEIRRAVKDLRSNLEQDVKALEEPIKEAKTEFERPFQEAGNELSAGETESKKGKDYTWVGPKPLSGPTPEDSMRDLEGIEQSVEDEAS